MHKKFFLEKAQIETPDEIEGSMTYQILLLVATNRTSADASRETSVQKFFHSAVLAVYCMVRLGFICHAL